MAAIENQNREELLLENADLLETLEQSEREKTAMKAQSEREKAQSEREKAAMKAQSEREKAAMKAEIEELRKKLGNESNQSENFESPSSKDGSDSPTDGSDSSVPTPSGNEGGGDVGSSGSGGGSVAASSLAEGEGIFNLNLGTYVHGLVNKASVIIFWTALCTPKRAKSDFKCD
eukprot:CAMPEP_0172188626 /NCGR_PEP_ID=MMETSP1050-20130122/22041_1 /TAXON_ID=233186 /ORGANISM="Cryptomonas curvata, Strain CCAP979/52" /LENGTH=174 /DNA_ID=CAMNT_0012863167 /DNA_START=16 /DNA_END=540 /DNA_ORIENTATION=+